MRLSTRVAKPLSTREIDETECVDMCSFPLLFRILSCLDGFCLFEWKFPVEGLDWGF